MYKVAKQQPHKTVFEEYYANKLLAMLRRDMINATCKDEYTGATMEKIVVPDLFPINPRIIKLQDLGEGSAYMTEFEIMIDDDNNQWIRFEAENDGNPLHGESIWGLFNFSFIDYQTATEYNDVKMAADTITELTIMVNDHMSAEVYEYAQQEYLDRD